MSVHSNMLHTYRVNFELDYTHSFSHSFKCSTTTDNNSWFVQFWISSGIGHGFDSSLGRVTLGSCCCKIDKVPRTGCDLLIMELCQLEKMAAVLPP